MSRNCCHISLAFILKLLNYLQSFAAISILLYSIWMLNQWNHHIPPPSYPPSAAPPETSYLFQSRPSDDRTTAADLVADVAAALDNSGLGFASKLLEVPTPWFIYSFMGVGIVLCCISLIGCIAAEAINGCCLCFYTLLMAVLLLIEAALVAFIAIDRQWMQILPYDPTGEFESLRSFIEDNMDICKWVGIAVVVIQALSLLLGFILRGLVSPRRADYDLEDDYDAVGDRVREPLLGSRSGQAYGSAKGTFGGGHSDLWSRLVKEKYGLRNNDSTSASDNASGSMRAK